MSDAFDDPLSESREFVVNEFAHQPHEFLIEVTGTALLSNTSHTQIPRLLADGTIITFEARLRVRRIGILIRLALP